MPNSKKERKEQYGRHAPPYLEEGSLVSEKFRTIELLGGGGFGQIYRVFDEQMKKVMALKIEPKNRDPGRMVLEQRVLCALNGSPHAPQFVASGSYKDYHFIVMQMLGRNLTELRRRQPKRRLSLGTMLRVGKQCLLSIKCIHNIGFIHRDVKPSNFCVGLPPNQRTIYVVDFGMVRQFRSEDGVVRKERMYAGFRGTMRYVSVAVHERREPGPADDLWSLFYALTELLEGRLPWSELTDADAIAHMKKNIPYSEMGRFLPPELEEFTKVLEPLKYHELPDYDLLNSIMQKSQPADVGDDDPYDWEFMPHQRKSRKSRKKSRKEGVCLRDYLAAYL